MAIYRYCIPQFYYNSVFEIPYKQLKEQGKKTLFFDLDNTIMSYDQTQIGEDYISLLNELMTMFNVVIVSNSGYSRVSKACLPHQLTFIHSAKKPFKSGFKKALKASQSNSYDCVFVGDQMMTDVFGANRMDMLPILVKPVKQKTDHIFTRINRKLERQIIKKIKKKMPDKYHGDLKKYAKDIHQL